ncbi:hypothetical protein N7447_003834 [Penicillium robsamsonii]|uniref:uncharacterized protein n=1 Tax=Penicillium robsamsonii TaxID=1792511 RepID=UPI002546D880|nr:uncharacterized protein N7447_003834 [Penicillium robsamsonii]KAJ5827071.1 hypothetical protein N7447_003834 [Penicillium robsamsonii]
MTRCVKGSELSHLELSMLWAREAYPSLQQFSRFTANAFRATKDILILFLHYIMHIVDSIIPRLLVKYCGNSRYGNTTKLTARQLAIQ